MNAFLRRTLLTLAGVVFPSLAQAGFTFPKTTVAIEAPADAERVVASFPFENTGTEPVVIDRYESGCSCVAVEVKGGKMRYAPGEKGELRATFEIGTFRGEVDKHILLWLDGDPEEAPSVDLVVRVDVPVLVEIEPKTLRWQVGEAAEAKSFRLRVLHDRPIRIKDVSGGNDAFEMELVTLQEGRRYEVKVTPQTTERPGIGVFRIQTDSEIPRHQTLQGFAVVARPASTPSP